jgi:hypothetical protein
VQKGPFRAQEVGVPRISPRATTRGCPRPRAAGRVVTRSPPSAASACSRVEHLVSIYHSTGVGGARHVLVVAGTRATTRAFAAWVSRVVPARRARRQRARCSRKPSRAGRRGRCQARGCPTPHPRCPPAPGALPPAA